MTNDLPRRTFSVRAWLLSVTGLAVVASLLVWHAQVADLLDFDAAADKQPVVAEAPAGSAPPVVETLKSTTPPTQPPTQPPSQSPKPKETPTKPSASPTRASDGKYSEEDIDGLSPKLRSRLRKAIKAARADGVRISITSARRSAAKQRRLLKEAIAKYGSYKAATRWVLPPDQSAHVQGKAVDIGPQAAMVWLNKNGWRYGVCRRYDNEPWHFEALTTPGSKCPPRESHAVAKAD
jgi:D-alanyl-D-alanine carboxypeptidase